MSADIPTHIAIIMDGNGRWAQARGLPRTMGHKQGSETTKKIVKAAAEMGVSYLTLFGFSSENWNRPIEEISELMRLLRMYLRSETAELHRNNIRLRVVGNRNQLAADIVELIENAETLTQHNDKITVVIALDYGGRNDILQAAAQWAQMCRKRGVEPDMACAEEHFSSFLMTEGIPDPDILIRTSGEMRISNFMLWQCAYAELFFSPVFWPDFKKENLEAIVEEFGQRDRRFGKIKTVRGES
ncbi:MAG: di-trans,poly-cis-decaprenylcistransferase [Alphaproteobacteria bacterium CG_4_9_14_3_um_filter_47_13]|nr:MAG: di-trans,poly-cis-decaprenylcistransferase [Alphaproteobacteria bacterium CG_4_9_14_3_um_filter_47_13]